MTASARLSSCVGGVRGVRLRAGRPDPQTRDSSGTHFPRQTQKLGWLFARAAAPAPFLSLRIQVDFQAEFLNQEQIRPVLTLDMGPSGSPRHALCVFFSCPCKKARDKRPVSITAW